MTMDELKGFICRFFNSMELGCSFVKGPTSKPATKGKYVSVGVSRVEQYGSRMVPTAGKEAPFVTQQVASVTFTEVEGDGDTLRAVRNALQGQNFREYASGKGFTVWTPGTIMAIDTFDGEFVVRQWRMECGMNFEDVERIDVEKIESVEPLDIREFNETEEAMNG